MKREVKFRGKGINRINSGEWVYGDLLHRLGLTEIYQALGTIPVIPETVGQFTGLKDKNGVEIYEGDILKTECGDIVKVEFDHIYCSFGIIKNGWAFFHYFHEAVEAKDWEVIGNIHDNPELLK